MGVDVNIGADEDAGKVEDLVLDLDSSKVLAVIISSVLFPDKATTHEFSHEMSTKVPEGGLTGAATGGVLGGALGLLAGIGSLAIPGVGPRIAAGPLMVALSGATVGGVSGALIGLRIPEIEAKHYENRIAAGSILISGLTEMGDQVSRAKDLLESAGAEDISVTSVSEVESTSNG